MMTMKNYLYLIIILLASCGQPHNLEVDRSDYPVKGIDLSSHNGTIDFGKVVNDSVEFVYMKATEGTEFKDPMFDRYIRGASEQGLLVGAYHFFRFDSPGHLQAYNFLDVVHEYDLDLPLAIDVEEWTNEDIPLNVVLDQLNSMISVLQSTGYPVIIYTNKQGFNKYIGSNFPDVPLWISDLAAPPEQKWTFWQHSHMGKVNGISGWVDINTYNGNRTSLDYWLRYTQNL